uniref:Regulatory protein zeste n=1 Tax=Spodoptera frugiperda TaxID=7108 RepID=A0A2H1W293_SPOFR
MENRGHKKRQRSENWFKQDKLLLTELVKVRVSDIENKNTDTNTNTKKHAAWVDLQSSFNSMCAGGKRTISQLKSQWGIIKMNTKRMRIEEKKLAMAGSSDPVQESPNKLDDIGTLLPFDFMLERNKAHDHDENQQVKAKEVERSSSTDSIKLVINEDDIIIEDVPCSKQTEDTKEEVINKNHQNDNQDMSSSCYRKKQKAAGNKTPTICGASITELEIKCRKELHAIQMDNEKRKSRNLDLEEELLRRKIEYYEKKSRSLVE